MTNKSLEAIAALRDIEEHNYSIDYLMKADNRYVASIVRSELVERRGTQVRVSRKGAEYLERANSHKMPMRKHVHDLSPTVEALLHVSNLRQMQRKKAS